MPIVNDNMVTAAELQTYQCPSCKQWFRDFIKFQCVDCEKKFWYEITLNPDWFPKKLEDGTPDWNSVKKDKTVLDNHWSHGRLNIKTMEMERVAIDRDGKKWDYSVKDYPFAVAEKDADVYNAALRELESNKDKTPKQVKDHHNKMEKVFEKIDKEEYKEQEEGPSETEREKKKEQKEVMKLIDKK